MTVANQNYIHDQVNVRLNSEHTCYFFSLQCFILLYRTFKPQKN